MDAQGIFRKVWMETQFVSKRNCGGSVQTFLKIALEVLSQKWRLHYLCTIKINTGSCPIRSRQRLPNTKLRRSAYRAKDEEQNLRSVFCIGEMEPVPSA